MPKQRRPKQPGRIREQRVNRTVRFVHDVRDLMQVRRFTTVRGFQEESVAEHSYYTALYAMLICDLESLAGDAPDVELVLRTCLLHDLEETRVSDIPRPFKHSDPELKDTISRASSEVFERLVAELPSNVGCKYVGLWKNSKGESYEQRIVKAADLLEALVWSSEEDMQGNMRTRKGHITDELLDEVKKTRVRSAVSIAEAIYKETLDY
ncbi:MAG: YfbR-like 5'-deoxynucleotidase [Thermoprotei archaeon]